MGVHNEECKLRHAKEWKYYTNKEIDYPEDFKPNLRPCEEGSDIFTKAMELCDILNNTAGMSSIDQKLLMSSVWSVGIFTFSQSALTIAILLAKAYAQRQLIV